MKEENLDNDTLAKGVTYNALKEALAEIEEADATMPKISVSSRKKRVVRFYALRIAAALIPAFVLVRLLLPELFLSPEQPVPYFEAFENSFVVDTRSINTQKGLETEAFQAYDRGEYAKASKLFKELLETDYPNTALAQFFLANSLLARGKAAEAVKILEVLNREADVLVHEVKWYLGIGLLHIKDSTKASTLLQEISQESDIFSAKASELLRDLK